MLQTNRQVCNQADLQARFLLILPRIKLHAEIYFRHLPRGPRRDDAIAETVGLVWKWYVRLIQRGKNPHQFPSALACYAARVVRSGRRVSGHERAKDVLSPLAQQRHHFTVSKLPGISTLSGNPLDEALHDNAQTPPDEAAAFRIDFPTWLSTWDERRRNVITDMAMNERTLDLADKYGCSPGRISQMRTEFRDSWHHFHGEVEPDTRESSMATA